MECRSAARSIICIVRILRLFTEILNRNIMLTPQGNICLIDFNISFFLDENAVLGYTDGYTSPEQYIIALDKESERSDWKVCKD